MILSKCAICGAKKSKFVKKQETSGILSSLGLKTPLSKIPFYGDVLFGRQFHWKMKRDERIMNENCYFIV